MKKIANSLKKARIDAELTQTKVGRMLNLSNKIISNYEREVSEPDFCTTRRLAELYQVSTDFLYGLTLNPRPYIHEFPRSENESIRILEDVYGLDSMFLRSLDTVKLRKVILCSHFAEVILEMGSLEKKMNASDQQLVNTFVMKLRKYNDER